MVSSLPNATVVRQRYLIERVLGQGGFARTYLALDQERFQEACVIKEFFVAYQDEVLVDKAKKMFHREASILHQIQHPQIPRFWAAFEEEGRLFLVQDYVKGETYRSLLNRRKKEGKAFTEAEVLHFLGHLLPVLSYLHDRHIVHRDISPDNVMLASDQKMTDVSCDRSLPILIDFGAVKEATSGLALVSSMTRVGKIGYAPPEQLQTGNVQSHSDLYSLAVTCLVLLTGREPNTLLDSQTLQWKWDAYASISEPLAAILTKMLSLHPSDRYVSARRIWLDLLPLLGDQAPVTQMLMEPEPLDDLELMVAPLDSDAVGHASQGSSSGRFSGRAVTTVQQPLVCWSRVWNGISPQVAIVGSLLAILGMGTFIFRAPMLSNSAQILQARSTDRSASVPEMVVNPGEPTEILFNAGEISKVITGSLQGNSVQVYTLKALRGQIMTVALNGSSVVMNITRANGMPLETSSTQTRNWAGTLPSDDEYHVRISGTGAYNLELSVSPLNREVTVGGTQRLKFALGKSSTMVTGTLKAKQMKRYLVKAQNNKMMVLNGVSSDVMVTLIAPNGDRIGGTSVKSNSWQGRLPGDGDYVIEVAIDKVMKDQATLDYQLGIEMY